MLVLNLIYFLFFSVFLAMLVPYKEINLLKQVGLLVTSIVFLYTILLLFLSNTYTVLNLLCYSVIGIKDFNYFIGLDILSLSFILLTSFIFVLCILSSYSNIRFQYKTFIVIFLLLEIILLHLFSVLDLFFFYICFETILIPMFLLIGIWGSRQRRVHAGIQFFFYTLIGSFFMLFAISLIYTSTSTTNLLILNMTDLTNERQLLIWICFFFAFAVKIPMFPFHIWLPEAHVEAPTIGSVVLAGILLKLGGYGFLRFLLPLLPFGNDFFLPSIITLSTVAVLYTSLTAIRQIDLKKVIAYASVSHMNFVMLGIFTPHVYGLLGSVFLMLSHGIVSSGLFFCVGIIYERYHTRLIKYYGGLAHVMPVFAVLFFILILANFSFPGTSNFIGEFLVLAGLIFYNFFCTFFALISIIFAVVYSIWSYNRILFGFINPNLLVKFGDITKREFVIVLSLVVLAIFFGLLPSSIIYKLEWNIQTLLLNWAL